MGQPFYGDHAQQIEALVAGRPPDVVDRLVQRARTHHLTKMRTRALQDLTASVSRPAAAPAPDVSVERAVLLQQIAQDEFSDPDGEHLVELRALLTALDEGVPPLRESRGADTPTG
jgi:hypothetical protein